MNLLNSDYYSFLSQKRDSISSSMDFMDDMQNIYHEKKKEKKEFIHRKLKNIQNKSLTQNKINKNPRIILLLNRREKLESLQDNNEIPINNRKLIKKNMLNIENELFEQINIIHNQINEETRLLHEELTSNQLFHSLGLTLAQTYRYNLINGINKYYDYLVQITQYYENPNSPNVKDGKIQRIKENVERRTGRLPSQNEIRTSKNALNNVRQRFINPLQNQDYPLFLNLKKKHLQHEQKECTTVELFPLNRNTNKTSIYRNLLTTLENITLNNPEMVERLGINKLKFDLNEVKKDGLNIELVKNSILYWVNELLLPIQYDLSNSNLNDTYLTYNDFVLLNLQFFLLYLKQEIHSKNKANEIYSKGGWSLPFRIGDHVYKPEHIRYSFHNKYTHRKIYPKYNYQISSYFIGYMIQHYVFSFFPTYVPQTYNISYNLNKNIFETNMNRANINKPNYVSCTLGTFFQKPCIYKREDFTILFFRILKQLSFILDEMNHKIGFIHYDTHCSNLIINYKYSNNSISENNYPNNDIHIIDFDLKIIDLTFSYLLIKNIHDQICSFKYANWQIYRDPNILNPLFSSFYKHYDIMYFIITTLFYSLITIKNNNHIQYVNILEYNEIINILKSIYRFNDNCLEKYINIFKQPTFHNTYNIVADKNYFLQILGENVNKQYFIASNLYQYLIDIGY